MTAEASSERREPTPMTYVRVVAASFGTGLRSMAPLAALVRKPDVALPQLATSEPVRILFALASAGEIVADKLPMTPSRLMRGPLSLRIMLGALTGGIVASSEDLPLPIGSLIGAVGAALGSWAGATLRQTLTERTPVPDQLWAVIEDVVAVRLAVVAAA